MTHPRFALGSIAYINVLPVMHGLPDTFGRRHKAAWEIVYGSPDKLNERLARGGLDLSPVSSIEYARHQSEYALLPDMAIASRGAVGSVVLFSRRPLAELDGARIGICRATATSRVLLRILLESFQGVRPQYVEGATAQQPESGELSAALLIGDEALAFRAIAKREPGGWQEHDLGAMWFEATGLPMIFAVWAVRRDTPFAAVAELLGSALRECRERNASMPPALLAQAHEQTGMPHDELRQYYQQLYFRLGEQERQGLLRFYALAAELGLCPPCERLELWPAVVGSQPTAAARPTVAGKGEAHGG
jgi:chorismate dehydratase